MARAALPGRLIWQLGRVIALVDETPRTKSIILELPAWGGHRAGQHVDVRLTAEDGYQAQRSYSIASAPAEAVLMLTVERLADGEVSSYLFDELQPGDQLELRGPIGGYFVWEESLGGPLALVAGGSGIVPLRAILRHWTQGPREVEVRLVYSSRTVVELIYREELARLGALEGVEVHVTLTRESPPGWQGHTGRVNADLLESVVWPPSERPLIYVCGPTAFVETVAALLVVAGHEPRRIRTERFGPTGT